MAIIDNPAAVLGTDSIIEGSHFFNQAPACFLHLPHAENPRVLRLSVFGHVFLQDRGGWFEAG